MVSKEIHHLLHQPGMPPARQYILGCVDTFVPTLPIIENSAGAGSHQ